MKFTWLVSFALLVGCAGTFRTCSSVVATSLGADWLVVQYRNDGQVLQCWRLPDTSVDNEQNSDGIYWLAPSGHLVHLSGWYNRVQVKSGDWEGAAKELGLELSRCD